MNTDPKKSTQPCGCDPGADHLCEMHLHGYYGSLTPEQAKEIDKAMENHGREIQDFAKLAEENRKALATEQQKPENWGGKLATIKDSGERVKYASGALRDPSTGKIKWSRITFGPMMRRWAAHLTAAEVKYPDPTPGLPNFSLVEGPEELVRYKESAMRHFMSWFHGETDEDHAAAVFFNINGVEIIRGKNPEVADPFKRAQ